MQYIRHIRTDIATQDVFYLFALESTLDDQTTRAIYRAASTHFGEHVLDDVFWLSMHTSADFSDVGEDGLLAFSHDLWCRNRESLARRLEECWVRSMQLAVEAVQQLKAQVSGMRGMDS